MGYRIQSPRNARLWLLCLVLLLGDRSPAWSQAGSPPDQPHWAFQRPVKVQLPRVRQAQRTRTPIDAFLLQRLESRGLTFSPDAAPATLVRRIFLDLIGLPPSPEELAEYLRDVDAARGKQPDDAYERWVDRLLASPRFGERWGRHWLDVAGYADTVGYDGNPNHVEVPEGKWRYRDYVIRAWNDDTPYDVFLREQLAGDEMDDWRSAEVLSPAMLRHLTATGFLRTARDQTTESVAFIPNNFYEVLNDTLEIVGGSLLGLTVNCARCHDHKFDPIPQEDYYRLMAIFTPAYNPADWKPVVGFGEQRDDRTVPDRPAREVEAIRQHNAELDQQVSDFQQEITAIRNPRVEALRVQKLQVVPEDLRDQVREAADNPGKKRSAAQKDLLAKYGEAIAVTEDEIRAAFAPSERERVDHLAVSVTQLAGQRRSWGKIQALFDVGPPPATRLLRRGQHETPGEEVAPGYLRVLCEDPRQATMAPSAPYPATSGRRTELVQWLTARDTRAAGLVARVMVSRVWQHLFGKGLAAPDANFGLQGAPPIHPELLDWLAVEFQQSGWQMKSLIRLIMTSTVYRQSSALAHSAIESGTDPIQVDPQNLLLWRMPLRRLEGEVIRDSLMAVAGTLQENMGGPPVIMKTAPDGHVDIDHDKLSRPADAYRRSVYLVSRRAYHHSLMTVFDQPNIATTCARREASAVPLQSLAMLNEPLVRQMAARLGTLSAEAATETDDRIYWIFRRVMARDPDAWEVAACREFVMRGTSAETSAPATPQSAAEAANAAVAQAWVDLCHTMLNTSEFLCAE